MELELEEMLSTSYEIPLEGELVGQNGDASQTLATITTTATSRRMFPCYNNNDI